LATAGSGSNISANNSPCNHAMGIPMGTVAYRIETDIPSCIVAKLDIRCGRISREVADALYIIGGRGSGVRIIPRSRTGRILTGAIAASLFALLLSVLTFVGLMWRVVDLTRKARFSEALSLGEFNVKMMDTL
jgi:hypothetical protein